MARNTAEQIFRGLLRNPFSVKVSAAPSQWAGTTILNSGSATITVSTTNVKSNSLILHSTRGAANVGSSTGRPVEVKSIVDGSYFSFGTADGVAMARDTTIHWMLFRQD